jgi:threonine synthase
LKQSSGTAVAVSDHEIRDAVREWGSREGVFAAPEGAASVAAYRKLLKPDAGKPFLGTNDKVVLFNTGTGLKYLDVLQEKKQSATRHIGGIIGPY